MRKTATLRARRQRDSSKPRRKLSQSRTTLTRRARNHHGRRRGQDQGPAQSLLRGQGRDHGQSRGLARGQVRGLGRLGQGLPRGPDRVLSRGQGQDRGQHPGRRGQEVTPHVVGRVEATVTERY